VNPVAYPGYPPILDAVDLALANREAVTEPGIDDDRVGAVAVHGEEAVGQEMNRDAPDPKQLS
jgi:hypothetical protein